MPGPFWKVCSQAMTTMPALPQLLVGSGRMSCPEGACCCLQHSPQPRNSSV